MHLKELGELKLIKLIRKLSLTTFNPQIKVGIGDDCSVFNNGIVVTTDAYLEDIHFVKDYFSYRNIGKRAVCATLSDIAAMAAEPIAIFISALLPKDLKEKYLIDLYAGIKTIAKMFRTQIAGGDLVNYPKLGLILTAIGKAKHPKLRSQVKAGDYLYLTGYCGISETGRLALKFQLPQKEFMVAIKRHLTPIPRIYEALKLKKFIRGLIDTSDGLSTDCYHLATESQVKLKIFYEKLPIHPETFKLQKLLAQSNKDLIFNLALNSGEDYELLFSSPNDNLPKTIGNVKLTCIGKAERGRGVYLIKNNKEQPLTPKGYDHFSYSNKSFSSELNLF
ncbi:MAG: thiamine-phosphate kinase [candidate division WOR-3 bacterium]|nr:thiamine-phosphate kinase [candidate division WOR-3 bacterium]MDW7987411.1 thiamine-phosphate kinase [candidate division WOR-3 bacterium]